MVYYRRSYRRTYRRKTYGRKRTFRRNFKTRSFKINRRGIKVHQFAKFVNRGVIVGASGTTATYGAYTFQLPEVHNWATDFQGAYDQFRIKAVKVMFIPSSNVTSFETHDDADQKTAFYSRLFTVFDPNDKNVPGSLNELREYATCKWSPNNVIHKRFIYPRVLTTVNEGSGTYGTMQTKGSPWINMVSNSTEYFGIKYAMEHPALSNSHTLYVVECKYYLQFRNAK